MELRTTEELLHYLDELSIKYRNNMINYVDSNDIKVIRYRASLQTLVDIRKFLSNLEHKEIL